MRAIVRGDRGKEVVDVQTRLRAQGFFLGREGADGHFGPHTERAVREFQQRRLLLADGAVGENTWTELVEAGHQVGERLLYLRVPYERGDDVLALQRQLNELGFDSGPEDGIFGPLTDSGLTEFQRNAGINMDGIVGEATLSHLRRIRMAAVGRSNKKIPDRMNGYVGRVALSGLTVSIDPAHGGKDSGGRGVGGLLEKTVNLALARDLAQFLEAEKADVHLVREDDRTLGLYERTARHDSLGADLQITVHHGHNANTHARGAAAFYFANGSYFSESGKRLAGYMVQRLVKEVGRVDLHPHGCNYACLREPQGLTVMIEPGVITHPEEGAELATPEGVRREARAIVGAIRAYLERL
ncbi:MAG: N-acetylmuramoyl-L-alanine amidase [Thermoleophilia bacterium]